MLKELTNSREATLSHSAFLFGQEYIRLRKKEGRIYRDEELRRLPDIPANHRHAAEWKIRKSAALKLRNHFQKKDRSWKILEPGCGNGWLSNLLAANRQHQVTGADINETELEQAARVFSNQPNLQFIKGSLDHPALKQENYDAIVFASSIQYFPSLPEVIHLSMELLNPGGELHILDSPFYQQRELTAARQRTIRYFESMGMPGMAAYYFHHCLDDLTGFNYTLMSGPTNRFRFFNNNQNPFPWICIHAV